MDLGIQTPSERPPEGVGAPWTDLRVVTLLPAVPLPCPQPECPWAPGLPCTDERPELGSVATLHARVRGSEFHDLPTTDSVSVQGSCLFSPSYRRGEERWPVGRWPVRTNLLICVPGSPPISHLQEEPAPRAPRPSRHRGTCRPCCPHGAPGGRLSQVVSPRSAGQTGGRAGLSERLTPGTLTPATWEMLSFLAAS